MRTDWRTQVAYLIEEVFSARCDLMDAAMKIIAAREARYSAAPPSGEYDTKEPVCRRGSSSRYLTHSQVIELLGEAESRVSRPAVRSPITVSRPHVSSAVASRAGYLPHTPTGSEFRARCETYGTHEMEDVVDGDCIKTVCKWCGKFYGRAPMSSYRPLLAR